MSDQEKIKKLYLRAVSRPPVTSEVQRARSTLSRLAEQGLSVEESWAVLCHAMFASNEFLMRF